MIAVLDYGIGNLRSACKALQKVGAVAVLVQRPEDAAGASGIVVPGVGAFGACVGALRAAGFEPAVREAVAGGLPVLGICVGFQMLFEGSDEDPGVPGLGLMRGRVVALPASVKRPQMQWNRLCVRPCAGALLEDLGDDPWVYFVHSYSAPDGDDVLATCDYGGPVIAVVGRTGMWATQFHPEKSGRTGLRLLANFAAACSWTSTRP